MAKQIVVRVSMADGTTMYRHVDTLEHTDLCKAFALDPVRTTIELPKVATAGRSFDGVIYFGGQPAGRLWVARDGERFRDIDPTAIGDFWNQPHTRM